MAGLTFQSTGYIFTAYKAVFCMLAAAVNGIPIFLGGFYLCVQTLILGQNSHPQGNPFIWEAIPTVSCFLLSHTGYLYVPGSSFYWHCETLGDF